MGVIVRDKNGPVADLTKDDFVVLDRGKPQTISVFSVESGHSESKPLQLLPQNTFSDLPQYGDSSPRSLTIVLLDNLNTLYGSAPGPYETTPHWFEDLALANAKAHLIEFIKQLDPRDRVAVYGLRDSLHVLCDFTSDRSQLLRILTKYDAASITSRERDEPSAVHIHDQDPGHPDKLNPSVNESNANLAGIGDGGRAGITMAALQSIAAHVANLPGRKNLVWLTANLPFSGTAMARILSPAQIAAYPVDGRGLLTRASLESMEGMEDEDADALGTFERPDSSQPVGIDTMETLGEETGGEAFVNSNDITRAIRKAVGDSAVTYTLGFYIDRASIDGKFHELKVQLERKGLSVRYPKAYLALEDTPATKDQNRNNLLTAVRSPIESSAIPVEIGIDKVDKPLPHSLSIFGSVDIHNFRLMQDGGRHKGALDVVTVEQDEAGEVLKQSGIRLQLQFTDKQYADYLKSGFRFHQSLQPQENAATLRVLVEDAGTAEVGSVIIPLSQLK
ncbi:MAG: VWA domain-containing protein [Candidatus Sulfotelmatobacter sp.]